MALNTNKDLKIYYSIHEVAEQFNVAESLLRFWEQEFPQLRPHKAGRNIRQYSKEDVDTVRVIYNLVKVRGLKLAAARNILSNNKEGTARISEAIDRLKNIRTQLKALSKSLNTIDPTAEDIINLE